MSPPLVPTALDRAAAALRFLVKSTFPGLVYAFVHEYAVHESDGATFSGTPTDATFSPQLPTRVPYAPALAGSSSAVPAGTLAYVGFANADPSKPFLVRFAPGATSTTTAIDADAINLGTAAGTAARVGDLYSIGTAAGVLTYLGPGTTDPSPTKVRV